MLDLVDWIFPCTMLVRAEEDWGQLAAMALSRVSRAEGQRSHWPSADSKEGRAEGRKPTGHRSTTRRPWEGRIKDS